MLGYYAQSALNRRPADENTTPTARYGGPERRAKSRTRALLAGKIIVGNGSISCDCVVRDLSMDGARVRISRAIGLPKVLTLLLVKDGLAFEAAVTWRRADELGLALMQRWDLRNDADPARRYVRHLWRSLQPR